jgi:hypothetical protein
LRGSVLAYANSNLKICVGWYLAAYCRHLRKHGFVDVMQMMKDAKNLPDEQFEAY